MKTVIINDDLDILANQTVEFHDKKIYINGCVNCTGKLVFENCHIYFGSQKIKDISFKWKIYNFDLEPVDDNNYCIKLEYGAEFYMNNCVITELGNHKKSFLVSKSYRETNLDSYEMNGVISNYKSNILIENCTMNQKKFWIEKLKRKNDFESAYIILNSGGCIRNCKFTGWSSTDGCIQSNGFICEKNVNFVYGIDDIFELLEDEDFKNDFVKSFKKKREKAAILELIKEMLGDGHELLINEIENTSDPDKVIALLEEYRTTMKDNVNMITDGNCGNPDDRKNINNIDNIIGNCSIICENIESRQNICVGTDNSTIDNQNNNNVNEVCRVENCIFEDVYTALYSVKYVHNCEFINVEYAIVDSDDDMAVVYNLYKNTTNKATDVKTYMDNRYEIEMKEYNLDLVKCIIPVVCVLIIIAGMVLCAVFGDNTFTGHFSFWISMGLLGVFGMLFLAVYIYEMCIKGIRNRYFFRRIFRNMIISLLYIFLCIFSTMLAVLSLGILIESGIEVKKGSTERILERSEYNIYVQIEDETDGYKRVEKIDDGIEAEGYCIEFDDKSFDITKEQYEMYNNYDGKLKVVYYSFFGSCENIEKVDE